MKYFLGIYFIGCLFLSCNSKSNEQKSLKINFFDSIQNIELKKLDSLALSNYNDSAKWGLYVIHCDDSCLTGGLRADTSLNRIPIAFLDIKLALVDKENDTLSLLYYVLYNDSTPVNTITSRESPDQSPTDGIMFDLKNDSIIGYLRGEGLAKGFGPTTRYSSSLQPYFKTYLLANKTKLNPWLLKEAIKRKVLQ